MAELINSSASEMEIPSVVKKPLKRCLYTIPSRVARPQDRSVPKMNRVSLPPTEVVSKTRNFNALNKNRLLQKDECNNVKYVVLIAHSSKKNDVSNSMNVFSVSNACNSLKCNMLDDILTRGYPHEEFMTNGSRKTLVGAILVTDNPIVDKGIGHNLFNIRQFCDSGMKVALDSRNVLFELSKALMLSTALRTLAYSLEQMGVVERRNHTLMEAARTMLTSTKLPIFL
ncbi:hypothetical protein Tco_0382004 [Tanacetum coccineum]